MKKLFIFLILAAFIAGCSQYTCPTYSKTSSAGKSAASVRKI